MSDSAKARRTAIGAAALGNLLEWYDFAVYSYVASIIAKHFFSPGDDVAALLSTFAVFGLGFVIRPLGAFVVGRLGDLQGRKVALLITIFLMAAGTIMIGLIPAYAAIGVAAPALLVFARLLQSFSVGGEFATSIAFIVEWAPEGRRGYVGSFQQISTVSGLLLGSGVAALLNTALDTASMESWGWRIPFLMGGIIGIVGFYMRRKVGETPAFEQTKSKTESTETEEPPPALLAAKAFGFAIIWTVSFYIFLVYMPTFTQRFAGLSRISALWANTGGLLLLLLAIPIMGSLSDRIGRKPLLLTCCALFVILTYPLFQLMQASASVWVTVLIQLGFGLVISLYAGPAPSTMVEIFRTKTRSTYMSIGYALATVIFGGFAPFIATWLISITGSPLSPTFYVMAAAVLSGLTVLTLRETAHSPLR
jgi:MHS family proline/betaine transporter-like MFS transporter